MAIHVRTDPAPVANSIVKFFDISSRPPKGGYRVEIEGVTFEGNDESQVIAKVSQWRKNNGTFTTEADVTSEAWRYWCNRDPERCRASGGTPEEMPPIAQQVANLAGTIARSVAAAATGQPVITPQPVSKGRLEICHACHRYDRAHQRCYECGCYVNAKTSLAQEKCPLGKW